MIPDGDWEIVRRVPDTQVTAGLDAVVSSAGASAVDAWRRMLDCFKRHGAA